MKPPQAFRGFAMQFHQDRGPVDPDWGSECPAARRDICRSFRQRQGDPAVRDLYDFLKELPADGHADLKELRFKESKADRVIPGEGIRRLFKEFQDWASSIR